MTKLKNGSWIQSVAESTKNLEIGAGFGGEIIHSAVRYSLPSSITRMIGNRFEGVSYSYSSLYTGTPENVTISYTASSDGAGTEGATKILIDYVDGDHKRSSEEVVLGSSGSDSVLINALNINKVEVLETGGAVSNKSDITLTGDSSSRVMARIDSGFSFAESKDAFYHVPAGKELIIKRFTSRVYDTSDDGGVTNYLYAYNTETGISKMLSWGGIYPASNYQYENVYDIPLAIPEKHIVFASALSSNNVNIYFEFQSILKDKE